MTLTELWYLFRRHALVLAAVTLLCGIAGAAFAMQKQQPITTTLLISVAITDQVPTVYTYDAAGMSIQFAEGVAGWFKSPELSSAMTERAGFPISASASVQTKQNFLIDLRYGQSDGELAAVKAAREVLDGEIAKYNQDSKYKLAANLHGISTSQAGKGLAKSVVAGLMAGFVLAAFYALLVTVGTGRIVSLAQIERIAGKPALLLSPRRDAPFLDQWMKKIGKDAALLGVDFDPGSVSRHMQTEPEVLRLPQDAERLMKAGSTVLVVRLDTSTEKTLRLARAIAGTELTCIAV